MRSFRIFRVILGSDIAVIGAMRISVRCAGAVNGICCKECKKNSGSSNAAPRIPEFFYPKIRLTLL